jgi:hypothetical protein
MLHLQAQQVDPPTHPPNSVAIRRHHRAKLATIAALAQPDPAKVRPHHKAKACPSPTPCLKNTTVYPKHLAHPRSALNTHTSGVMGVKG